MKTHKKTRVSSVQFCWETNALSSYKRNVIIWNGIHSVQCCTKTFEMINKANTFRMKRMNWVIYGDIASFVDWSGEIVLALYF